MDSPEDCNQQEGEQTDGIKDLNHAADGKGGKKKALECLEALVAGAVHFKGFCFITALLHLMREIDGKRVDIPKLGVEQAGRLNLIDLQPGGDADKDQTSQSTDQNVVLLQIAQRGP